MPNASYDMDDASELKSGCALRITTELSSPPPPGLRTWTRPRVITSEHDASGTAKGVFARESVGPYLSLFGPVS